MEIVREGGRFVLKEGDKVLSWIVFEEEDDSIHIIETRTAEEEKGKGYASKLVDGVLEVLKDRKVKVSCPYVKSRVEKKGVKNFKYTQLLKLKEEIEKFNKYRSPEAHAELLDFDKKRAKVLFTGPFCVSCGVYDYFEDLIVDLNAKVESFEEFEEGFVVTYFFPEDLY